MLILLLRNRMRLILLLALCRGLVLVGCLLVYRRRGVVVLGRRGAVYSLVC